MFHLHSPSSFPTAGEFANSIVGFSRVGRAHAASRRYRQSGLRVIEINQTHRHTRARRGKTDAIDAEAAARKVLSGEATGAAKETQGIVEAIRQLSVARDGAMKARTAALCQLGDLLVTAPAALREQVAERKTLEGKATVCARLRPGPLTTAIRRRPPRRRSAAWPSGSCG